MYVGMSSIVCGKNNTKKSYAKNAWAESRSPNTRMLKKQFWDFETKCRLEIQEGGR